jgi:hypothetical protein
MVIRYGDCSDLGSGMEKKSDPGSRINIPDPQHCVVPTIPYWG